jgi:hypothetical protein
MKTITLQIKGTLKHAGILSHRQNEGSATWITAWAVEFSCERRNNIILYEEAVGHSNVLLSGWGSILLQ